MRQLGNIADYALAADVLAYGEAEARMRVFEGGRVYYVPQVDDAYYLVRHLDADGGYLVRDGGYADVHDAEGEGQVAGEVSQLRELHARVELQVVARDRGTARDADDVRRDAEAVQRRLQALAVEGYLVPAVHGGRRALAEQVYGRELVLRRGISGALYLLRHGGGLGLYLGARGLRRGLLLHRRRVHGRELGRHQLLLEVEHRLRRALRCRLGRGLRAYLILGEVADLDAAVIRILVRLVVHGNVDNAVFLLFRGLRGRLGLLPGLGRTLIGLRLRDVFVLRPLAPGEPARYLAYAQAYRVHQEEQQKRQKQRERAVDAEHRLQRHGQQACDEAAALH